MSAEGKVCVCCCRDAQDRGQQHMRIVRQQRHTVQQRVRVPSNRVVVVPPALNYKYAWLPCLPPACCVICVVLFKSLCTLCIALRFHGLLLCPP